MLYLIGIGLHDEKDITLKGLEAVRSCSKVFLEYYTSKLACNVEDLQRSYGKDIIIADRKLIEQQIEEKILQPAKEEDIALLVIGDPFSATTHVDICMRAEEMGIKVKSIHNASVLTAIGAAGLELYKYGKTTSIPFDNENVTTPIEVYKNNQHSGLHTLFLLDLDPTQDRFMTIKEALEYLISKGLPEDQLCVGCAGLGSDEQKIKAGKASKLKDASFTLFPQCLIAVGKLHFMEEDALKVNRLE